MVHFRIPTPVVARPLTALVYLRQQHNRRLVAVVVVSGGRITAYGAYMQVAVAVVTIAAVTLQTRRLHVNRRLQVVTNTHHLHHHQLLLILGAVEAVAEAVEAEAVVLHVHTPAIPHQARQRQRLHQPPVAHRQLPQVVGRNARGKQMTRALSGCYSKIAACVVVNAHRQLEIRRAHVTLPSHHAVLLHRLPPLHCPVAVLSVLRATAGLRIAMVAVQVAVAVATYAETA